MKNTVLSSEEIEEYHRDGYIIKRKFLNENEVSELYKVAVEDDSISKNSIDLNDRTGKKTKLTLWFTPGDNTFGYLTRSERMINNVAKLLDSKSPVCHFHSKLMQKEPRIGGAWEWHQDYGYWYKNQFMFPDQLISVMIALTDANQQNGCLQVIKGSHKLGRVNHGFAGEQVGADMVFVNNALKTMDLVYVELKAGDALFFHSNTLHRSEANLSEKSRWSLISCYNSQSNLAYDEKSASYRTPVNMVPDDAILLWESSEISTNDFLKKDEDPALKETGWENNIEI